MIPSQISNYCRREHITNILRFLLTFFYSFNSMNTELQQQQQQQLHLTLEWIFISFSIHWSIQINTNSFRWFVMYSVVQSSIRTAHFSWISVFLTFMHVHLNLVLHDAVFRSVSNNVHFYTSKWSWLLSIFHYWSSFNQAIIH